MESMNISLPEPMKKFVDAEVAEGHYSSASEYVRQLIRAEEKRKAQAWLQAELLKGLEGPMSVLDDAAWDKIRIEAREMAKNLKKDK